MKLSAKRISPTSEAGGGVYFGEMTFLPCPGGGVCSCRSPLLSKVREELRQYQTG